MTTGQLARGGAFLRAARLLRRGYSQAFAADSIHREWPGIPYAQIRDVVYLARMGVAAADKLMAGGYKNGIPAGDLPDLRGA